MTPEFSRLLDRRRIGTAPFVLEANRDERERLAERFGLVAIRQLSARLTLACEGDAITVQARLLASIVQSCAVSGEALPVTIDEPLAFRFVPEEAIAGTEIELQEEDCDAIPYSGHSFDIGEAIAQSLALAIDPYACGPQAEQARHDAGLLDPSATSPFAALASLKRT